MLRSNNLVIFVYITVFLISIFQTERKTQKAIIRPRHRRPAKITRETTMDRRIVIEAATNTKTIRTSRRHRIRGDNRRTQIPVVEGVAPAIMITRCTLEVNKWIAKTLSFF